MIRSIKPLKGGEGEGGEGTECKRVTSIFGGRNANIINEHNKG